jgi:hypothetical protein
MTRDWVNLGSAVLEEGVTALVSSIPGAGAIVGLAGKALGPEKDLLRKWCEDRAQQKAFVDAVKDYGGASGIGDADIEDGMRAAQDILRQNGASLDTIAGLDLDPIATAHQVLAGDPHPQRRLAPEAGAVCKFSVEEFYRRLLQGDNPALDRAIQKQLLISTDSLPTRVAEAVWADYERARGVADTQVLDPGALTSELFASEPTLRVRLDRVRRFTRRTRSGSTTFGTARGPGDAIAYGEGAIVQVTVENGSSSPAVVSVLDVVVESHDASVDVDYSVVAVPQMHMEVPTTVVEHPLMLDDVAQIEGVIPVNTGQIALDAAGTATAHHNFDIAVLGAEHGLWQLAIRARYFGPHNPDNVYEALSEDFYVVKK